MIYKMQGIANDGCPVPLDTPDVLISGKVKVFEYIEERIRAEGLDWQCGSVFKTREMDRPMAFFGSNNKYLRK